jgi:hypothetical protein
MYKTLTSNVVLHGYETWPLALRAAHRWTVFEKRMLRRIFGSKREEIREGWRNNTIFILRQILLE